MKNARTEVHVVPVVTVAPVTISRSLTKYLSKVTKRDTKEPQKTGLFSSTAHILQKVEDSQTHYRPEETQRVPGG